MHLGVPCPVKPQKRAGIPSLMQAPWRRIKLCTWGRCNATLPSGTFTKRRLLCTLLSQCGTTQSTGSQLAMTKNRLILQAHSLPFADEGLLNMAGGCCGTTPDHIHAIAEKMAEAAPGNLAQVEPAMRLSGLGAFSDKGTI